MSTTTHLTTAEELLKLPRGRFRYELVEGELITISPAGEEHGVIVVNVTLLLAQYVKANKLGLVYGAETGFKISSSPDTVLAPDVAFVRREHITATGLAKGYRAGAPDLAVEVMSPGDTVKEVDKKAKEWLAAGASAVWVVNPKQRTVIVYRSSQDAVTLTDSDDLGGQEVVPGFRCHVSDIFAV